jgi:Zn-dependent protease
MASTPTHASSASGAGSRPRREPSAGSRGLLGRGLRLGRIFGIEIVADWSLILIFALVAFNLGAGVFPRWHPDWGAGLIWFEAITAAVLFFVSVLLHELSHAVVGRMHGIPVPRITLFLFGGVSHMEGEAPTPKAEFLMAVVGPLTSIVLGLLGVTAASALLGTTADATAGDPMKVMQDAGPVATLLLWLGPINLILGVFNLVPGFPLDGGRVLRSALWFFTGSLHRATLWASRTGQGFAFLLMATGLTLTLTGGIGQGLWLILIGWFLNTAAKMSYRQLIVREAFEDVAVSDIMRTQLASVSADTTVADLVQELFSETDQQAFPVVEGDRLLGLICLEDIRKVPQSEWARAQVRAIMTPREELVTAAPTDPAHEALTKLAQRGVDQLPVLRSDGSGTDQLAGVVRRQDLMRWLSLHGEGATPER